MTESKGVLSCLLATTLAIVGLIIYFSLREFMGIILIWLLISSIGLLISSLIGGLFGLWYYHRVDKK
jgi:hypothetical protein